MFGIDEMEQAAAIERYRSSQHVRYPIALDTDGHVGDSCGAIGLPLHAFIERGGTIRACRFGEITRAEIETALKTVLSRGRSNRHR